jgi:hypothetical protein
MLVMSSCQSDKVITEYKTIYATPDLYFPKYPAPGNNVLPLDKDYKRVTKDDIEIEYVIMPYWYYKLITDYKAGVDEAKAKYEAFNQRLK